MERSDLQRIVERDCNHVYGKSVMSQPDVAAFAADHIISEALQQANQTIAGNAARHFHAASTEISSSLT